MQKLQQQPTIEQVLKFLKDNRAKSFVLDIETDSTIMADENAEKQRRTEFVGVLGELLPQLAPMITADPKTATFCGEILKFATAPFRAGRSLDGAIDELVEQMKAKGDQPQGDDPTTAKSKIALQIEQMKQQTVAQKRRWTPADRAGRAAAERPAQADGAGQRARRSQQAKLQATAGRRQADMAVQNQKMQESREAHQAQLAGEPAEDGARAAEGAAARWRSTP